MTKPVYINATADLLDGWVGRVEARFQCSARAAYEQAISTGRLIYPPDDDVTPTEAWVKPDSIADEEGAAYDPGQHWLDPMWLGDIRLNLRIPSVMDRCARVLAARVGLDVGATAPQWVQIGDGLWRLLVVDYDEHGSLLPTWWAFNRPATDPAEAMRLALEATND